MKRDWTELSENCYLLPSNISDWSAEQLLEAYIQLTESEAAVHRSGLGGVVILTRQGVQIRKGCVSRPTQHQQILLDHLEMHPPEHLSV